MQQRHATRRAVNHAPSRRDIGCHLAAVAHQPFARPRRKLRHPFAAQVAASPLPIKHLHLVQAARLIALEPHPYRVVVEIERFRDLGTVPAIVQQQNRVRPARHTVGLTRMPHHRLQGRAFLGAQKSTAKHGQRRTYPSTDGKDFLEFPERQGIYPDRVGDLDRRGRRLDRLGRRPGRAEGRTGERRLQSGAGLLRPGRGASDADRRLLRAGLPRPNGSRLQRRANT